MRGSDDCQRGRLEAGQGQGKAGESETEAERVCMGHIDICEREWTPGVRGKRRKT